jgi:hypothetical protein
MSSYRTTNVKSGFFVVPKPITSNRILMVNIYRVIRKSQNTKGRETKYPSFLFLYFYLVDLHSLALLIFFFLVIMCREYRNALGDTTG